MAESPEKSSFWAGIGQLLMGAAAVVTALVGVYVVIWPPGQRPLPPTLPSAESLVSIEWPISAQETFTNDAAGWLREEDGSDQFLEKVTFSIIDRRYRWEILSRQAWQIEVLSPFGPASDFIGAIDVSFVERNPVESRIAAGLQFGIAANVSYVFWVTSNNEFALSKNDGMFNHLLVSWTPIKNLHGAKHRIAVQVKSSTMILLVDDAKVYEYEDTSYSGGLIGLALAGWEDSQVAIVDFDNFSLHRPEQ